MNKDNEMPYFSHDLVKMLDEMFPLKPVSLDMTEREIFFTAGQRHVVEFLVNRYSLDKESS